MPNIKKILQYPKIFLGACRDLSLRSSIGALPDGHFFKQPLTPYSSQWASADLVENIINKQISAKDDPRWRQSGAKTLEEYEMYSWQICGITCFRMILEAIMPTIDYPLISLAKVAQKHGVYVPNNHLDKKKNLDGMYHQPLIEYARKFHLNGFLRNNVGHYELANLINNDYFLIASVHHSIRDEEITSNERNGHMVLINGYAKVGSNIQGYYIHNPSGFFLRSQANHFIKIDKWDSVFSGNIIAIKRY